MHWTVAGSDTVGGKKCIKSISGKRDEKWWLRVIKQEKDGEFLEVSHITEGFQTHSAQAYGRCTGGDW